MKYLFAIGLVAALCFLGVSCNEETPEQPATETAAEDTATKAKEKICEPGTTTQVKCNTCICSSDGLEQACTKKTCVEGLEEGEVKPEEVVKAENLPVPDTEQVKAENLPVPEADLNKPAAEIPTVAKDRRRRRRDDDDACEPGKNFKKECNDCVCPPSGKKSDAQICTIIAC